MPHLGRGGLSHNVDVQKVGLLLAMIGQNHGWKLLQAELMKSPTKI